MLKPIGKCPKRECFGGVDCCLASVTIREHARKFNNFRDPPTVCFLLNFYGQRQ